MSNVKLTEEQLEIVNHDHGPARVFAVAGAGKTTAMVHRIHRLIQQTIFSPHRILASSFSRASVAKLNQDLKQWPVCSEVKTQTLHSLGNSVINKAYQYGYLDKPRIQMDSGQVDFHLYHHVLRLVRQQNLEFKDELESIDQKDFLSYVGRCKAQLHYADLSHVRFEPDSPHRGVAQLAQPPADKTLSWYLDLYRLFEQIRLEQRLISYDDMLMTGWQLIVQYPDLLEAVRAQFDCIVVDEFQDVNRAQFGILDLMIRNHSNYMVIGDDDQTIYEWRGAEVKFLLKDFERRYTPKDYAITDNFRCKASQITLANAVIRHNRNRYIKQLSLTQGFDGRTELYEIPNLESLGRSVVDQVRRSLAAGVVPTDIAILVRVYAQTPYIEQFLIQSDIPYWGADLTPFYRRKEILDFLAFAHLAKLEARGERSEAKEAWERIQRVAPVCYMSRELKDQIQQQILADHKPFSDVLLAAVPKISRERTARAVKALVKWLKIAAQQPAKMALKGLDACIDYRDKLKKSSGFKETGQGKVAGVEALINYAHDKGLLVEFLDHLDNLQERAEEHKQTPEQCIRLTTIHQAKGLEWSVVLVPHCNEGTIPFGEKWSDEELEEERRLLYVAITRSKQDLYLYYLKNQPISQFLKAAQIEKVLKRTERVQHCLQQDPQSWQARDAVDLMKGVIDLGLDRYFLKWWKQDWERQAAIASAVQRCFMAAAQSQLLERIGLEVNHVEIWQQICLVPESASMTFPGLEALAQPKRKLPVKTDVAVPSLVGKLKVNQRVDHNNFGQGVVTHIKIQKADSEEIITVNFQKCGSRKILITKKFCALRLAF